MSSKSKLSSSKTAKKIGATRAASGRASGNNSEAAAQVFKNQAAWSTWLEKNHSHSTGIWVRLAKKNSGLKSVTYAEALESALCYGWIDGKKRPDSEQAWLQRFCPRSEKSIWSKINRDKALGLIKAGRMAAAGLQAIEQAQKNNRWKSAYDSPRSASIPDDFQAALKSNPKANGFFETLERRNRYAILFRIQTVKKPETRVRNIQKFIAMLERGEKIHP